MTVIRGIYETHLEVTDLERSIAFYDSLGLELDRVEIERRIAFYHIEGEQRSMLGLWETDDEAQ